MNKNNQKQKDLLISSYHTLTGRVELGHAERVAMMG
jgi:hypothetical protein